MQKLLLCLALMGMALAGQAQSEKIRETLTRRKVVLPNGWSLTPAGNSLRLGDLPLNMAVSPSGNWLVVSNDGQSTQTLELIDVINQRVVDSVVIPKSWYGLKFSDDGNYLYASGGNDNRILLYGVHHHPHGGERGLELIDSLVLGAAWPEKISPAGMDIDFSKSLLYVVTKENNSLYIVDLLKRTIVLQIALGGEGYDCLLSPNKKELYISCWGCDKLLIFDTERRVFRDAIAVGDNPNALCRTRNGRILYVANANDNSVSVIDLVTRKVLEVLNAALYPDAPSGSTTNGLALSADEKTLYVANADNNCLAVFDVSHPGSGRSKGFIPVGWYPTAVKVTARHIWVANGKGFSSMANPYGPSPVDKREEVVYEKGGSRHSFQYIGGLFTGTMSIIPEPDDKTLGIYSSQVYQNTPYTKTGELQARSGETGNPIPMKVGDPSPIKYVFYVIKENRTYDQVLGDIKEGNGDTSLVLFGEKITPNQHAIAREFVLLDNFYVDGEVSADGHNWSMGAYADDYLEKTWPTSYGDRGGDYDAEGNREIANNKAGFIWDDCRRAGVTYRSYGVADDYKPNIPSLKGHYCPYYTGFDLDVRDTARFKQWKREFDSLLAAGALPRFNTVRFGNDHTEGMTKGKPSPFAFLADNDLAVGEFVEYLSRSPIWKESVIFVLEDDAQNGPDHVDAHRSPVYLAGGCVKRHFVDHTMYSTSSALRTIELILGLAPMSQYDAAATPMWRSFTAVPDLSPFLSLPANIDLDEKNLAWNELAKKSAGLDFTREDRVPDDLFNEILWKGIRGMDAPVPPPIRAAFRKGIKREAAHAGRLVHD